MAKYSCTWTAYSDSLRTNKVGEIKGMIGVADTWDGVDVGVEFLSISRDYAFFSRHVSNQYEVYSIGKKYLPMIEGQEAALNYGQYMPLSWFDSWNFSAPYWDVELSSGMRIAINAGSAVPVFSGGWVLQSHITIIDPKDGVIYDADVADKRELYILPFGCTPWLSGGSPNPYGTTAIFRDANGDYGVGLIQWGNAIGIGTVEQGGLFRAYDDLNDFFKLVFRGAQSIDPYDGYEVEPAGGNPDPPEEESDPDFPPEPSFSVTESGMLTLFNPSLSEIQDLAAFMWSTNFDIANLIKIFADPIDAILGLSIVPINVTQGSRATFWVGNIPTPVSMYKCAKQFETVDCGTINVGKKYGSYLDFAPYTDAQIYLPFIGVVPIDVNDIMGRDLRLKYRFDLVSGACCAMISCGGKVLYTFLGQAAISVPITGHDWTNVINGAITVGAAVGKLVVTHGASAPTGVPTIASATINTFKQNIQRSGALGGPGGILGPLNPYLILTRPRAAWPKNLKHYEGYPSFISGKLGNLEGFTVVYKSHLEEIPATDEELDEIDKLLKEGVIL